VGGHPHGGGGQATGSHPFVCFFCFLFFKFIYLFFNIFIFFY
jgi:hypothetical protein